MLGSIEGTLNHALFLSRHLHNCDLQYAIIAVLIELGIPTKGAGFDYLKNAILLLYDDPTQMVTKETYPNVGKRYNPAVSSWQVEIAIRRAIAEAWSRKDEITWAYYFKPDNNGYIKRPTNSEFISMIVRFLELWQGCCIGGGSRDT